MRAIFVIRRLAVLLPLVLGGVTVLAQSVSFTGNYSENFDSMGPLGLNLPSGWFTGGANNANNTVVGAVLAGASSGNNRYNFGLYDGSDRALGAIAEPIIGSEAHEVRLRNVRIQGSAPACCRGFLKRELYEDVPGSAVTDLTSDPRFLSHIPSSVDYLTSFESPTRGDRYGAVLSGFLIPAVSGSYQFQVHADEQALLVLSPDMNCANALPIIIQDQAGGFSESALIDLQAGAKYCVTAFLKEDAGPDYLELRWRVSGAANYVMIPGNELAVVEESIGQRCDLMDQPATLSVASGALASFSVTVSTTPGQVVFYQWDRDCGDGFEPIPGANAANYAIPSASMADACAYRCYVAVPGCCTTSLVAHLTVITDIESPTLISAVAECDGSKITVTFSEPVELFSAQEPFNYERLGAPAVGAILDGNNPSVVCVILDEPFPRDFVGDLTVGNVTDLAGNPIAMGSHVPIRVDCPPLRCARTSKGTDFWLTIPGNYAPDPASQPRPQLCISGDPQTVGTVTVPGLGFSTNFTIPPSMSFTVTLPKEADLMDSIDQVEGKGIHVVASAAVGVVGFNLMDYTSDAFLGLPSDLLGTNYIVLGYKNVHAGLQELYGTQFALVACADGTAVTITPEVTVGTRAAGVPYVVQLNRGDTYQLRGTNDAPDDLSGTTIFSSRPVAVFGSHRCANIESMNVFFCDYIVEQLFPTSLWGTEFVAMPLASQTNDTYRFVALNGNTQIQVNGHSLPALGAGEIYELPTNGPVRVTSDQPIFIAQYKNSSDYYGEANADPLMVLVPSTPLLLTNYMVCTPPGFFTNLVNVVAPYVAGQAVTVRIDSEPPMILTDYPALGVSGAIVPVLAGMHSLSSDVPFAVTVYGFSRFESYGYPGGLGVACSNDCLSIECPTNTILYSTEQSLASFAFQASASNHCGGEVLVTCDPPSPSLFPLGTTTVRCVASDLAGTTVDCSFTVTVLPAIAVTVSQEGIILTWPPGGVLQASGDLTDFGSWTSLTNATSPYTVRSNDAGAPRRSFYRVCFE